MAASHPEGLLLLVAFRLQGVHVLKWELLVIVLEHPQFHILTNRAFGENKIHRTVDHSPRQQCSLVMN
jgi:hypothetical protein